MRYFLYEEQEGGCDYTIGCGRRFREITGVRSMAEAINKVCSRNTNEHGDHEPMIETHGEFAVAKATIFEVDDARSIDLAWLKAKRDEEDGQVRSAQRNALERAEYERLKRKFG